MENWQVWVDGKPTLVAESESLERALAIAAEHALFGTVIIAQPEAPSAFVLQTIRSIRTPIEKKQRAA